MKLPERPRAKLPGSSLLVERTESERERRSKVLRGLYATTPEESPKDYVDRILGRGAQREPVEC